jgi:hypothetical protein
MPSVSTDLPLREKQGTSLMRYCIFFYLLFCILFNSHATERIVQTSKGNTIHLQGTSEEALKLKSRYVKQLIELLELYEFPFKGTLTIAPRPEGTLLLGDTLYIPASLLEGKDNVFYFLSLVISSLFDHYFPCEIEFRNALSGYLTCLVIDLVDGKQYELQVLQTLSERLESLMEESPNHPQIKAIHHLLAFKVLEHKVSKNWILYALGKSFSLRGRVSLKNYLDLLEKLSSEKINWWREDWWDKQELADLSYSIQIVDETHQIAQVWITQKSGKTLRFPIDITLSGGQEAKFIPNFFVDSSRVRWQGNYNFQPDQVRLNDNYKHPLLKTDLGDPYFFHQDSVTFEQLGMQFSAPSGWKLQEAVFEGKSLQIYGSHLKYPHTYLRFLAWEPTQDQTLFQVTESKFNRHAYFETKTQHREIFLGKEIPSTLTLVDEFLAGIQKRSLHVYAKRGEAFLHFWLEAQGKQIEPLTQNFIEFVENVRFTSDPQVYEIKTPQEKIEYPIGTYGRSVLLLDSTQAEPLHFTYIPLMVRLNQEKPLLLFHSGELSAPQIRLIQKYRPADIWYEGRLPQAVKKRGKKLPRLSNFYTPETDFCVTTSDRIALMASTLWACRQNIPLVLWDPNDPQGFASFPYTGKIHLVGDFPAHLTPEKTRLASHQNPKELLSSLETDYVVTFNSHPQTAPEDYFSATLLATYRKGTLLPLELPVQFDYFALKSSDWVPEHLQKKKVETVMVGEGELSDETGKKHLYKFMLPVIDEEQMNMASSTMSTKVYGEPYLIQDPKTHFQLEDLVPVCSEIQVGQKSYLVSTRMKTIVGSLVYGHEDEDQMVFLSPSPQSIRQQILDFFQKTHLPQYLAIVGNPQRFPFYYEASSLYRLSGTTQAELPTDSAYGNVNWDSFIEVAVGRILTENLQADSCLLATLMTYTPSKKPQALLLCPGFPDEDSRTQFTTVFPNAEFAFQEMEKELQRHGYQTKPLYRRDCTLDQVVPEMSGKDLIFYINHANQESWTFGPKKLITHFRSTLFNEPEKNTKVLPDLQSNPFVYSGGCLSAGLDLGFPREKSFPLVMMDKGAIGFLGNTRFGIGDSSDHMMKEFLNQVFYHQASVGTALQAAKNHILLHIQNQNLGNCIDFQGFRRTFLEEFHIFNLFGDPAIRLSVPQKSEPCYEIQSQWEGDQLRLLLRLKTELLWEDRVLFPSEGKEHEVTTLGGPGLFLSNFPPLLVLADLPPSVLPGASLKIPLPQAFQTFHLERKQGPSWCLGQAHLNENRFYLQVHFVRFICGVDQRSVEKEMASEIELLLKFYP